jgi:hypothetical protein
MAIDRTKLTREIQWRRIPVFAFAPDHRFGRSTSRTSNFARRSKSAQRAKGRASFNLQLHNHEQQQTQQHQHRLGVRHRACATL